MPNLKANEVQELETCNKLLMRTQEGKLEWRYSIPGQVYVNSNGVFFSLYFPNAEIANNDYWRAFAVQVKESEGSTNLVDIFRLGNPSDVVSVSQGLRLAPLQTKAAIDEIARILVSHHAETTYGRVLEALDL